MATDLTLDFDHEQYITMNNSETGISIDQDGEWGKIKCFSAWSSKPSRSSCQ